MSYVEELHARHKERRARIEARAYRPPSMSEPAPAPLSELEQVMGENYQHAKWVLRQAEINPLPKPPKEPLVPSFTDIIHEVCRFYNVTRIALKSVRRDQWIVRPRQVACYLAYVETGLSFVQVGNLLGGRDHTTALHACRKIERLLQEDQDEQLALAVAVIRLRLYHRLNTLVSA